MHYAQEHIMIEKTNGQIRAIINIYDTHSRQNVCQVTTQWFTDCIQNAGMRDRLMKDQKERAYDRAQALVDVLNQDSTDFNESYIQNRYERQTNVKS